MKRPEGFDPSARRPDPAEPSDDDAVDSPASRPSVLGRLSALRAGRSSDRAEEARVDEPIDPASRDSGAARDLSSDGEASDRGDGSSSAGGAARPSPEPVYLDRADSPRDEARRRAAMARRASRRASRERHRAERQEVRRFTRRSRHRRATWVSVAVVALLLGASVGVAVFSPLLSLQTITVDGTVRVDAGAVQDAVDGQLGTPLARIDFDRITRELEAFPLIASYVTETAPPHTLVIRITERQPIATVADGDAFELVDPAGIVVQRLDARQEGVPLVDVGGAPLDGTAFRSAAEVLLSLPVNLRSTVDSATASTADDVALTLSSGQKVVWGSAEHSEKKAQVLAGLMADQASRDPSASVEYDVSAPDNGIIRPI